MPATAAQIFGPTTIDPGFTTTGEKTLLTMNTTLPAGGKNVIIALIQPNGSIDTSSEQGRLRIKKGTTILYEMLLDSRFNQGGNKHLSGRL